MRSRCHALWIAALLGVLPWTAAHAGNGKFDPTTRTFDFCVSIRFKATTKQKQKLEALFEAASGVIYETTNGQHQFGTITAYNDKMASKNADVWILDGTGSSFASPNGYGIPGRSIVLYYDSLIDKNGLKPNSEYVLAHAFSHFAYGILDEYHDGNGNPAECLAGTTATHACLLENYKAALASGTKAKMWCLSANHDPDLDTAQSAYHHKSCWETAKARFPDLVIPSSIDYLSPAFDPNNNLFQWIEGATTRRFVEIIDHSGSMGSHTSPTSALSLAKEAAKLFVELTNAADRLGVVAFDDTVPAQVVWNITSMNPTNKDQAKLAIDGILSGGGTGIGEGLKQGLAMIDADGGGGCIQAMILLSDGYHNSGSHPNVVLPGIIAKSIPVFTIGLGNSVDTALMQNIASSTGGRYFAAPNANQLNGIFAQISAELSDGGVIAAGSNFTKSGQIKQDAIVVDAKTSVATFIITWDTLNSTLAMVLKGPNGISVTIDVKPPLFPGDKPHVTVNPPIGIEATVGNSAATLKVSKSIDMEGTWTLTFANKNPLTNTSTVNYEYQVLSNDSDILLAGAPDKLAYTANDVMTICATVNYEAPITNVDVRAAITRPDGSVFVADLKDDGSLTSGDPFANDGNFAYRFNGWNQNGIYLVDVDVDGASSAKTVQGETIDDKTDPIGVKNFHRHTEFAVSLTGSATIDTTTHFVDLADLEHDANNYLLNKANVEGLIDLDLGLVDPKKQPLVIYVKNVAHTVDPSKLIAIDDFHYVFEVDLTASSTTPDKFTGDVDLFKKGTSAGGYVLASNGLPLTILVQGNPTLVRFKWGNFDETVSVNPKVKAKSNGITTAKYDSTKQECNTDVFYVTSALVKLKKAPNQDKLSLRARFTHDFDPSAGTTTLRFGSFIRSVSNWTTSPTNPGKFDFSSLDGLTGAKVDIHVDTELREITVECEGLSLKGFPNPAVVELSCGGFSKKYEITLAPKKSSLSY